jgi:hypothetical protein
MGHHVLQVVAAPSLSDVRQDAAALGVGVDDAGGGGQVGFDFTLEVESERGVGSKIGEPAATPRRRLTGDVEGAVDVVEDDFDAVGLVAAAASGGDVDGVAAL